MALAHWGAVVSETNKQYPAYKIVVTRDAGLDSAPSLYNFPAVSVDDCMVDILSL